jgi:Fic family protein
MPWNWEHPGWPQFTYQAKALGALERQFLWHSGEFVGAFKHIGPDDRKLLRIELVTDEALKTSEIEGEVLDRASVQSSLRQQSTCTSSACTRSKTATAAWAARLLKNHWRKVSASRPSFPLPTQLSAAKRLLCGARAQQQGYRDHRLADVFRRNSSRGTAQHDQRVEFYIAKAKLYEKLRGQLNERQEKVIARMFREGIDGFKGGLSVCPVSS